MGILLFELFSNPLFMGILNKWETLVIHQLLSEPCHRNNGGMAALNADA